MPARANLGAVSVTLSAGWAGSIALVGGMVPAHPGAALSCCYCQTGNTAAALIVDKLEARRA
jgi:hypothetical protein